MSCSIVPVRSLATALVCIVALTWSSAALAQWDAPTTQRALGIVVEGTNSAAVSKVIEESLGAGFDLADDMTLREALAMAGRKTIGPRPKDRSGVAAVLRVVCAEAGLDGVIYANVSGSAKSGYTLWAFVVDRDGKIVLDATAPVGSSKKRNKKYKVRWNLDAVSTLVQPGIDELRALPPGTGERPARSKSTDTSSLQAAIPKVSTKSGVAAKVEARSTRSLSRLNAPIVLRAAAELSSRSFSYRQPVTSNLRSYAVSFAPLFGGEVEAYPFSTAGLPVLSQIGWYGQYAQAFQVQSTFANDEGPPVQNVWRHWQVGLRGRLPVTTTFGFTLQGTFAHLGYSFRFLDTDEREREVPDVRYNSLRGSIEARKHFSWLDVYLGGGYGHVLSGGRVANEYFPRAEVGAADVFAGVSWALLDRLSIDLGAKATRYFYDMRPQPWDRYVAGGALDQYVAATFGLVYLLGSP